MHAAMKSVKAMKMAKKRAAVSGCNEVREGYEDGQEACSTRTKGHERHEEGPVYFLLLHLPQPYTI